MMNWRFFVVTMLVTVATSWAKPTTGEVDAEKMKDYKEVQFNVLRIGPEDYKNKKVAYSGVYLGMSTTFFNYMEKSGLKSSKHIGFLVGDKTLPVFVRKSKDINEYFAALKKGATVKVYGKVRRFSKKPEATIMPHYYLELKHIMVLNEPAEFNPQAEKQKMKQWKRKRRNR